MSEIRVGIISEGPLDQFLIRKIVCAEYPEKTFIFTNISPADNEVKSGNKQEGFGWGGVYRVCQRLFDKLEILHEAGKDFDLLVIHVDGDVMMLTYESANLSRKQTEEPLPCIENDAGIEENCRRLRSVLKSWIPENCQIDKITSPVYCIPYINSDVWAAYSLCKNYRSIITENMSQNDLQSFLLKRGKKEGKLIRMHQKRVQKIPGAYRDAGELISPDLLKEMKSRFRQLELFCSELAEKMAV